MSRMGESHLKQYAHFPRPDYEGRQTFLEGIAEQAKQATKMKALVDKTSGGNSSSGGDKSKNTRKRYGDGDNNGGSGKKHLCGHCGKMVFVDGPHQTPTCRIPCKTHSCSQTRGCGRKDDDDKSSRTSQGAKDGNDKATSSTARKGD